METVDFLKSKSAKYAKMSLKLNYRVKIKTALKRQMSINSFCVYLTHLDKICKKNDFVYFKFYFFHF